MLNTTQSIVGSVVSLWRYPVKSTLGEELNGSEVTERGLLGDRVYALLDLLSGKIVSAKTPQKWGKLFDFRSTFIEPPRTGEKMPPVRIALPDGNVITSEQDDLNQIISNWLGRKVNLISSAPEAAQFDAYWPDIDGLPRPDGVTEHSMPVGTFFDACTIHVITTATLDRLRELYPQGRFEVRRFRPNVVIKPVSDEKNFIEDAWVGSTLAIGDRVRLNINTSCPRCIMTTLPQADLPKDLGILRTVAQHNGVIAGLRTSVLQGGTIRRGDPVWLQ